MPAIREHDLYVNDVDDDDGMPPLVDNPNTSMSFTFFTDMTPITALSLDPTAPGESTWDNPASVSPVEFAESEYPTTNQMVDRVSHGKKRDASYIPRPPNAFILFRSSFIRSQQVPEKVEGNHSTLSKIIGKYWKTLPREEREIWEAKALVAQAEHRKRYPDWRFRPGANALAKLKVKDGPGTANKRRSNQSTKKSRGDAESKKKNKSKDERCSMIADLLVEGKTGAELESALRNWENGIGKEVGAGKVVVNWEGEGNFEGGHEGRWAGALPSTMDGDHTQMESVQSSEDHCHPSRSTEVNIDGHNHPPGQPRCKTPPDDRFKVPLTAMFKRSLSAPAMHADVPDHIRHNSIASNFSDVTSDAASSPSLCSPFAFPSDQYEDHSVAVYNDSMGHLSPLVLPSGLGDGSSARWNDPYNLLGTLSPTALSPDCSSPSYGNSPSVSPVDMSFGNYTFPSPTLAALTATKPENISAGLDYPVTYDTKSYSPYSALKGWADGQCASFDTSPEALVPHVFVNQHTDTPAIYEWSPFDDTICVGHPSQLYNAFESSYSNGFGF